MKIKKKVVHITYFDNASLGQFITQSPQPIQIFSDITG